MNEALLLNQHQYLYTGTSAKTKPLRPVYRCWSLKGRRWVDLSQKWLMIWNQPRHGVYKKGGIEVVKGEDLRGVKPLCCTHKYQGMFMEEGRGRIDIL